MIIAANYVRDRHIDIIYNNRKMICGLVIGTEKDKIIHLTVIQSDFSMNQIQEGCFSGRHKETDGIGCACPQFFIDLFIAQGQTKAFIFPRTFFFDCRLPSCFELFRLTETAISFLVYDKFQRGFAVNRNAIRLKEWTFIPVEPEPGHAVQDYVHHFLRRPLQIRIFNAKDECSAGFPRP